LWKDAKVNQINAWFPLDAIQSAHVYTHEGIIQRPNPSPMDTHCQKKKLWVDVAGRAVQSSVAQALPLTDAKVSLSCCQIFPSPS
jgi:hypothetical protein